MFDKLLRPKQPSLARRSTLPTAAATAAGAAAAAAVVATRPRFARAPRTFYSAGDPDNSEEIPPPFTSR